MSNIRSQRAVRTHGLSAALLGLGVLLSTGSVFIVAQLTGQEPSTEMQYEEDGPSQPATEEGGEDQEESAGSARRGARPHRMDPARRDAIKEENAMREAVGNRIGQMNEAQKDLLSADRMSFEELKQRALEQLGQGVAQLYTEEAQSNEPQLGCFDQQGNVTNDRSACAESQSGFFGMPSEEEDASEDLSDVEEDYTLPDDEEIMNYGNQEYRQYQPPQEYDSDPMGMGNMTAAKILEMMEKVINKLPVVIQWSEEAGVPVSDRAKKAAADAKRMFEENKGPCAAGDGAACMKFADIGRLLEGTMRVDMEEAIMKSGNFQLGMKIGLYMGEGMEEMGPPPGMMNHGAGPEGYGGPGGYGNGMQGGYGNGMQRGYGNGMQGGYPPSGYGGGYNQGMQGGFGPSGYGGQGGYGNNPGFGGYTPSGNDGGEWQGGGR